MSNIIDFAAMKQLHEKQQTVKRYEEAAQAAQDRAAQAHEDAAVAALTALVTGDVDDIAAAMQAHKAANDADASAQDHLRAAEQARENAQPTRVTLDELAAILAYQDAQSEPTANADGVRVGDLFYLSYGYDMTCVEFWQVVALKGKRTAIMRRIQSRITDGDGWTGHVRPVRDCWMDDKTMEKRTSTCDGQPRIASDMKHRHLHPCKDFDEMYFNHLD